MIHFYLTGDERDHTQPDGRIHWGTIENGEVIEDHSEGIEDPTRPFGDDTHTQLYESFTRFIEDYREELFEGLSDPIAVLENLNRAPIVAGVPSEEDDMVLWDGEYNKLDSEGKLTDEERAEVDQYEPNTLGLRTRRTGELIKNHKYPTRYRTVEIGTLASAQPSVSQEAVESGDHDSAFTVHGIWDTHNGEIVEDTSGEFEDIISEMVDDRFPLRDAISLARLSKPTRKMTIVDDTSGKAVSPKEVLIATK